MLAFSFSVGRCFDFIEQGCSVVIEMLCIHTQCLSSRVIVIRCVELCTAIKKKSLGGKSLPHQKALHRNTVCHAKKKL